jgi:HD-GYP domain-containing protein (c-di-GMP phosphodiesterase class II)
MTEEQFTATVLAGKGLLAALTERDRHTVWHQDRVGFLAEHLARQLGLSGGEIRQARATGIYHDVGKIAVPDEALFKPGPLTHAEWSAMQAHSEIGERILLASENPLLRSIAGFVRHHHERFDGSGYPDGLSAGEIPLVAQIVSIADAYDAMASERPYRPIRQHETIIAVLAGEVWQKWDSVLFDALVRLFERDPEVVQSYTQPA